MNSLLSTAAPQLAQTMASALSAHSAHALNSFYLFKWLNKATSWVTFGFIMWYVNNNAAATNSDGFNGLVDLLRGSLGIFFAPLFYLILLPSYMSSQSYVLFNYSDVMTFILINFVGDTVDLTNPFILWLFFYIPTIVDVLSVSAYTHAYAQTRKRLLAPSTTPSLLEKSLFNLSALYGFGFHLFFVFFP
jgi:hypothetical protein